MNSLIVKTWPIKTPSWSAVYKNETLHDFSTYYYEWVIR